MNKWFNANSLFFKLKKMHYVHFMIKVVLLT
jgi:hypothetical protein